MLLKTEVKKFQLCYIEHYLVRKIYWNLIEITLAPFGYTSTSCCLFYSRRNNEYVKKLLKDLFKEGIKCEMDLRNEKINYKVREHSLAKVPFIIVWKKRSCRKHSYG